MNTKYPEKGLGINQIIVMMSTKTKPKSYKEWDEIPPETEGTVESS
jgi:hypothetical protein